MKKFIISLVLAFSLILSVFGCTLITKNDRRDYDQIIATVKIDDRVNEDVITKEELVNYFYNYGYTYVNTYGMSVGEAVEALYEQLINRRILLQLGKIYYIDNPIEARVEQTDYKSLDYFMTEQDILNVTYNVYEQIESLLKSYEELIQGEKEEDASSTTTPTPRPTPVVTEEEEEKEDVKPSDIKEPDLNSTLLRRKAFARFERSLNNNGSSYRAYLDEAIKTEKEQIIIDNYSEYLQNSVAFDANTVQSKYDILLNSEIENYTFDMSKYDTKLGDVADGSFVLYNPKEGYGYVYNILIPFGTKDTYLISRLQGMTISQSNYETERAKLLNNITAKDLRESWVTAGYEIEESADGTKIVFSKDLITNQELFALEGTVKWICEEEGEVHTADGIKDEACEEGHYEVTMSGAEYSISDIMDMLKSALESVVGTSVNTVGDMNKIDVTGKEDEALSVIKDMIFTYGTDTGMFSSYAGYVSSPSAGIGGTETYVTEFANAAREVVLEGAGSYKLVGTDYGWHIIYCSEKITKDSIKTLNLNNASSVTATKVEDIVDEFSREFAQIVYDAQKSNQSARTQSELLVQYRTEQYVKRYESRFKDLLG